MGMDKLRNIVILKDLPSNVIEEAFVVLKKNQKIKNVEYADNGSNNFVNERNDEEENEFIIKEAELLINDLVTDKTVDNNGLVGFGNTDINKKYKFMKRCAITLGCILFLALVYIFV